MEVKTLKGIKPEKWMKFKALAAKSNLPMGKLFENIIDDYEKRVEETWNKILYGKKIATNSDAKSMIKILKKLRKERGFRDVSNF